ncbi:hypothetical protein BN1723_000399 [Verticillium longisporum]|uniref:Zn(2)-C6 fungal-type domain-containing protein n=1 Tax=Verticillium longisporum TaxID=100787 RepID=A0A0G4LEZ4_VERLO|nr:hypothetical protein BN1723_000399 [Verticillium longisporum]
MPGDTVTDWLSFDAQQPKKRRAELVCFGCHNKKIKCDLQVRKRHGHENCTHCATADKQCQTRPSKRIKRRHAAPVTPAAHKSPKPPMPSVPPLVEMPEEVPQVPEDGHHRLDDLATAASLPIFDTIHVSPPNPDVAATDPGHRETSVHLPRRTSTHHFFAQSQQVLSPSQRSAASTTRSDALAQSQSQTGDVDTGFLQVFGPENQHDAEKQAIEASFEPKAGFPSLQQQDLQESFIDTYWEYCYTWCPVLDRECLPEEMAQSPLLANALATAASHVQPPLLPHDGPAEYYRRAKALFYDDEELDGITSIKSIALFYWWAPRPPTVTHRHSSWWWTSGALLFAAYILPSVGGGYAVLMSLQIANTAGYTKRSMASSGLYIGYCLGNFVGPLVFKKQHAPRYTPGFTVVVITSVIAGLLAVAYRFVCVWDNRRRDKSGVTEGFDHAYEDDLTDVKNPQFRYIL